MDHESRINAALGKILRNFNFLELNIGLAIRALATPDSPESSHGFLSRANLPEAIERLRKLLTQCEHLSDISVFEKWASDIDDIRTLRNYYVHATWDFLPLRKEAELEFRIPPWRKEKIAGETLGTMRIEDLEADADRVEAFFIEYLNIRRQLGI